MHVLQREWMPGPAFPTLQLFNSGNGEYTKIHGSAWGAARGDVPPMHDVAVPHGVRALDCAESGTPACIPSVSFAHPVNPGKMAMPTVAEMVRRLPLLIVACMKHGNQLLECLYAAGVLVGALFEHAFQPR